MTPRKKSYRPPVRRKVTEIKVEREGHVFRIDDRNGAVIYMEDAIAEMHLGRKLDSFEAVIHRNGNPLDNRWDNLEIVTVKIPEVGS